MRKNIKNDKVIRAITIGLATMIATTSMPMTVLADEAGEGGSEDKGYSSSEETASTTADAAQESTEAAGDAAQTVTESVNDTTNGVKPGEVSSVTEDGIIVDKSQVVIDAAGEVKNEIPVYGTDGKPIESSTMVEDVQAAQGELLTVDKCLTIVESLKNSGLVTGSGYNEAFNANLEAFKVAVALYGIDGPSVSTLPEGMEDGEEKDALLAKIAQEQAVKDQFDAIMGVIEKYKGVSSKDNSAKAQDVYDNAQNSKGAEGAVADANEAVAEANVIRENAENEQRNAGNACDEAYTEIEETAQKFTEYVVAIENAKSISSARTAYDELMTMLDSAETTLSDKQTAYEAAKAAYEELEEDYANKKAALKTAKEAYEAALDAYDNAKKEYESLDGKHTTKIENLNEYKNELDDAKAALKAAGDNLENAEDKAEILATAATAAREAIISDKNAMLKVVDAIKIAAESDSSSFWKNQDSLFKSVMENYYVPEKLGGNNVSVEVVKGKNSFDNSSCNYFKVSYTDELGNKVEEYYNYSADMKSKTFVIFKKNDNEVAANEALLAAKNEGKEDITLYEEFDKFNEESKFGGNLEVDGYKVNVGGEDKTYTRKQFDDAIDAGTVVKIGTVYYEIGNPTTEYDPAEGATGTVFSDDITELEDGTIERTVKINSENPTAVSTMVLEDTDGDGKDEIVKKYVADQNVIIYHKNSLSNDANVKFETEEAAIAAAKANLTEGDEIVKDENGQELVKATNGSVDTHQISGTYIPIFTETLSMDVQENWAEPEGGFLDKVGDLIGQTFDWDEDRAKEEAIEDATLAKKLEDAGYYILDKSAVTVTGIQSTNKREGEYWFFGTHEYDFPDDYKVSVQQTFTYVSKSLVTTDTNINFLGQDFYAWVSNLFGGSTKTTAEKREDVAKKLSEQGKILVDYVVPEGNIAKATFTYIDRAKVEVNGAVADDYNTAMNSFEEELEKAAKNSDAKGYSNSAQLLKGEYTDIEGNKIKLADTKDNKGSRDVYGYEITFWDKQSEGTVEDAVVGQTVYDGFGKVKGFVTQNKNEKEVLLDKEDLDLLAKYARIEQEALDAKGAVENAKAEVMSLINEYSNQTGKTPSNEAIEELLENPELVFPELEDLKEFSEEALGQLEAAKAKLKELTDQKEDIEKKLADTIRRLTPDDDDDEEDVPGTPGGDTFFVPGSVPGALMAALPTTGVAGVRAPRAGRGVAVAGEEVVAGENKANETVKPAVKPEEKKDTKKVATTKLEDNQVPLAAAPVEETNNMNWWWLLLVALLGATGYEMYKKHQQKKAEAEAVSETINKED